MNRVELFYGVFNGEGFFHNTNRSKDPTRKVHLIYRVDPRKMFEGAMERFLKGGLNFSEGGLHFYELESLTRLSEANMFSRDRATPFVFNEFTGKEVMGITELKQFLDEHREFGYSKYNR